MVLNHALKSYITSNIKTVRYYDKTVYILEVIGQEEPSLYDGSYYQRSGANVVTVEAKDFAAFFKRYTIK